MTVGFWGVQGGVNSPLVEAPQAPDGPTPSTRPRWSTRADTSRKTRYRFALRHEARRRLPTRPGFALSFACRDDLPLRQTASPRTCKNFVGKQTLRCTAPAIGRHELSLQAIVEHHLPHRAGGVGPAVRRRAHRRADDLRAVALLPADAGSVRPAGAVRSPAPRRRRGDRLPLLPLPGGEVAQRRRAADLGLPQLPRADLEQEPQAGAGARELLLGSPDRLEQGQQAAALRLFQPL